MKECPFCKAVVSDDRVSCGVCGSPFGTDISTVQTISRPNPLRQASSVLQGSLSILRRHPDLFLGASLLLLLWLSLVAVPAILLFSPARVSDGLVRLLSLIDLNALQNASLAGVTQFRAASLFGVYFWAYALIVTVVISILYGLSFPLMVDQAVKTGRVNVNAAIRNAIKSLRGGIATFVLYAGIVFVVGAILLDFFFLNTGGVFPPVGVWVASVSFTLFWSYAVLRLWLVFPAQGIDRTGSSEAFGLSLDATRRNLRSSYVCMLIILAVLYLARAAVTAALAQTPGSYASAGIVALISIVVGGTVVGVIPSVYYHEIALRTSVKTILQPPRLEALQRARYNPKFLHVSG